MSTAKSIRVYDILPSSVSATGVWFVQPNEDEPVTFISSFRLDYDAWRHMGEPVELTITIEPGDKLNGATAIVNAVSKDPIRVIHSGVAANEEAAGG